MNIIIVATLFFAGSGTGQYLLKQISINITNNKILYLPNLIHGIALLLILVLSQGCYLLALKKYEINVVYPLAIGSSFLGVTAMSLLVLQEQLRPHVLVGSALVVAGLIITKS
jgi:multidrug transporter EmrE-like cation transporter